MSKGKNSMNLKKVVLALNIIVLLGLAGTTVFLFMKNRDLNSTLSLSEDERKAIDNKEIIDKVSKVFNLPDEEATIVLVNDADVAIKENPGLAELFNDIKQGDYLLIFRKAKLGVQYRPSENKIVKSTPVNLPIAVELVGSEEDVSTAEKKLTTKFGAQIAITKTTNSGIKQSFVFDIDADQTDQVKQIADELGYDVGSTLPAGITPIAQTEIVIAVSGAGSSSSGAPALTQEP